MPAPDLQERMDKALTDAVEAMGGTCEGKLVLLPRLAVHYLLMLTGARSAVLADAIFDVEDDDDTIGECEGEA